MLFLRRSLSTHKQAISEHLKEFIQKRETNVCFDNIFNSKVTFDSKSFSI